VKTGTAVPYPFNELDALPVRGLHFNSTMAALLMLTTINKRLIFLGT
jgi:hypothetical protein